MELKLAKSGEPNQRINDLRHRINIVNYAIGTFVERYATPEYYQAVNESRPWYIEIHMNHPCIDCEPGEYAVQVSSPDEIVYIIFIMENKRMLLVIPDEYSYDMPVWIDSNYKEYCETIPEGSYRIAYVYEYRDNDKTIAT